MRVGYKGRVFASPSLICHYVAAHDYRPPDEFITAVEAWDETNQDAIEWKLAYRIDE